jgi:hypothetical protein
MRARVLPFCGLAWCALAAPPLPAQGDFRQAAWGMTQAQVVATESGQPVAIRESGGEVIVEYAQAQFGDRECRIVYIFARDKLVRAKYLFAAAHSNFNDFIADYRAIEPLLLERHGKAASARAIWEDDSTQPEPKSYLDQDRATPASILPSDLNVGLAVSLGHLRLLTEWATFRSDILHALAGAGGRITHQIEYRSAEWEWLENEVRPAPSQ